MSISQVCYNHELTPLVFQRNDSYIWIVSTFWLSGQVFQALEKSDLGCGAGGGRNNAEVFRLAGLTFLTNANADDTQENGKTLSTFCLFFKLILKLT